MRPPTAAQLIAEAAKLSWIARHGLRESTARRCEHSLRTGRCGRRVCEPWHDFLDHARMWRQPDGGRFMLAHLYDANREKLLEAAAWAYKNGLVWAIIPNDGWYGYGTTPIRFWYDQTIRPVPPELVYFSRHGAQRCA